MYFIHSNHLGTPTMLTDTSKNTVWQAQYQAFGLATVNQDVDGDGKNITLNLRFAGQYYDSESGLHYNWFRYYDPELGRYITSDPLGLFDGPNTYTYVHNNPIMNTDFMGLANDNSPYTGLPPHIADAFREYQRQQAMRRAEWVGSAYDFYRNYSDMRDANTIGADKYFHCKANCEATQRGQGGENAACTISDSREWFDQNIKGDPASASAADQAANIFGRSNASSSQSCSQVCAPFRPNGLPPRY